LPSSLTLARQSTSKPQTPPRAARERSFQPSPLLSDSPTSSSLALPRPPRRANTRTRPRPTRNTRRPRHAELQVTGRAAAEPAARPRSGRCFRNPHVAGVKSLLGRSLVHERRRAQQPSANLASANLASSLIISGDRVVVKTISPEVQTAHRVQGSDHRRTMRPSGSRRQQESPRGHMAEGPAVVA
jgi:hypothetical protein